MTLDKALDTIDPASLPEPVRKALVQAARDQCQRGRMEIRSGERVLIRLGVLKEHSFEAKHERRARGQRGGRRTRKDES